jgi:hypothetical protein
MDVNKGRKEERRKNWVFRIEGMGKFEKRAKAVKKGRKGSLRAEGRGIKKGQNLEERKKRD